MAGRGDDPYLLVAAIDFGTTFSGYAFSFKASKAKPDLHEKIRTNRSWGAELGFQSYKTPTSVLTNRKGSFIAFGFEAEQEYGQALEDDGEPDMLMFRHFKMMLHKRESVNTSAVITSLDGTIQPALDIFSYAIRYLKDHLLDALKLETGSKPDLGAIRWVITVPAIWVDESKQFMRKAALKAGCITDMDSKKLIVALEPEAASLCCRRMNIAQYEGTDEYKFPSGGTVDITMHVMQFDGKVKEVLRASGGPWGGTEVDRNFIRLLETVLDVDFINKFKQRHPQEWLQFLITFERTKKSFRLDGKTKITITIPFIMASVYAELSKGKSIDKRIKESSNKGVGFVNGMIVLQNETAKQLFAPVIESVVSHTRQLLQNPKADGLQFMFMVGGFSECQMLQGAIKGNFEKNGLKVLIPAEAQMAIIKGAVLFGHNPEEIGTRVSRYSYGRGHAMKFKEEIHKEENAVFFDEIKWCRNIFGCIVKQDEEVTVGSSRKVTTRPVEAEQTAMSIPLYSFDGLPNEKVEYTEAKGMVEVGELILQLPGQGRDREVELNFHFGGTEIKVDAKELTTGKSVTTSFDFLHH